MLRLLSVRPALCTLDFARVHCTYDRPKYQPYGLLGTQYCARQGPGWQPVPLSTRDCRTSILSSNRLTASNTGQSGGFVSQLQHHRHLPIPPLDILKHRSLSHRRHAHFNHPLLPGSHRSNRPPFNYGGLLVLPPSLFPRPPVPRAADPDDIHPSEIAPQPPFCSNDVIPSSLEPPHMN